MPKKKILIVEDDTFLQGMMSRKLQASNFEVSIALSGVDALKLVDGGLVPDMIILDMLLPGMTGIEFLTAIRAKPTMKATPVIVFSNFSEEKDISAAKALGINEYLVKSNFTLDELEAKIKTLLP
jgi:two-component system sensor histidine kinase ChiS